MGGRWWFLEKAALAVGEGDDGFVGIWPVQLPGIDLGLVRLCEGDIHIGHIGWVVLLQWSFRVFNAWSFKFLRVFLEW